MILTSQYPFLFLCDTILYRALRELVDNEAFLSFFSYTISSIIICK